MDQQSESAPRPSTSSGPFPPINQMPPSSKSISNGNSSAVDPSQAQFESLSLHSPLQPPAGIDAAQERAPSANNNFNDKDDSIDPTALVPSSIDGMDPLDNPNSDLSDGARGT